MYDNLDNITKAYLAGIFDGEGCISISQSSPRGINGSPTCILQLSIEMNSPAPSVLLINKFYPAYFRSTKRFGKLIVRWQATNIELIENFLVTLTPFLIVKKQQAELALEFIPYHKSNKIYSKNDPRKEDILSNRTKFANQMSILNTGKLSINALARMVN